VGADQLEDQSVTPGEYALPLLSVTVENGIITDITGAPSALTAPPSDSDHVLAHDITHGWDLYGKDPDSVGSSTPASLVS